METRKSYANPWRTITLEELAKHDDVLHDNAWMAVNGVVYDVGMYAAKHPGGASKIIKYAGKDATETFNTVHAYVNAGFILKNLQVGVLKKHPKAPKRNICTKFRACMSDIIFNWNKVPSSYFKQDSIVATYVVEFSHASQEDDWTMGITEKRFLHVYKCIGARKAWVSMCELPEKLANDKMNIAFKNNHKHIEITLRKPMPTAVWFKQLLVLKNNGKFVDLNESCLKFEAYIMTKKCLTPNVLLFGIQIVASARINVPIGFHVELTAEGISRPYTPVCPVLMDKLPVVHSHPKKELEEEPVTVLFFMIKIYPNGAFTQMLDDIPLDDGRATPTLQVSTPHGRFNIEMVRDFSILYLIAAGTGITPMLKIIQRFWHMNDKMRSKKVLLWHFVQKEYDLVWPKQFTELDNSTSWFHYFPSLTQVKDSSSWQGARGRVNPDLIKQCVAEVCTENIKGIKKACICGPPAFNSASVTALAGMVLSENTFVFSA